jgi:hypothetical protein
LGATDADRLAGRGCAGRFAVGWASPSARRCGRQGRRAVGGIGGFTGFSVSQVRDFFGTTTTTTVPAVVVTARRVDVHRELFGFEKTFLDGNASFELRAPVFQVAGNRGVEGGDFGDLTVLVKYALLHDRQSGDVLSVGLALTAPTGPGI